MGEFPNKATIIKTSAKAVELGRKGGLKKPKNTINYSIRNKVEWMIKDGYTEEDALKVLNMARDPQASLDDLYDKLEKAWKDEKISDRDFLHFKGQFHKIAHGEKININQRTVNINMELNDKEKEELLEFFKDESTS